VKTCLISCHIETFSKSFQEASLHTHVETLLTRVTMKTYLEGLFLAVHFVCRQRWALRGVPLPVPLPRRRAVHHLRVVLKAHEWRSAEVRAWRLTAFQRLDFTVDDMLDCLNERNVMGKGGPGIVYKAPPPYSPTRTSPACSMTTTACRFPGGTAGRHAQTRDGLSDYRP
jgi:hypothetical protein